jgi:hypothetical protein
MMTIKLNSTQQKLVTALETETRLKQIAEAAADKYREAMKHREDLLEMIADIHGVDLKKYTQQYKITSNGKGEVTITFTELPSKFSDRVKKKLTNRKKS